ncbi:ERF family protein [Thalassospira lohafexi]|nr:ERF family protein [Thalassospira lohafexi]
MITYSDNIVELSVALCAAQAEIENVAKDKKNPHFKSDYASLAAVLDVARPILAKHDISLIQAPGDGEGGSIVVETMLLHKSGQWIKSDISCVPNKNDAQGIGSVITYLRRYSGSSMTGIAQTDDDANADMKPPQNDTAKAKKPKQQPAAPDMSIKAENPQQWAEGFQYRLNQMNTVQHVNDLEAYQKQWLDELQKEDTQLHQMLQQAISKRRNQLAQAPADHPFSGQAA